MTIERPEAPNAVILRIPDNRLEPFADWLDQNSTAGWGIIRDNPLSLDLEFRFVSLSDASRFAGAFPNHVQSCRDVLKAPSIDGEDEP